MFVGIQRIGVFFSDNYLTCGVKLDMITIFVYPTQNSELRKGRFDLFHIMEEHDA